MEEHEQIVAMATEILARGNDMAGTHETLGSIAKDVFGKDSDSWSFPGLLRAGDSVRHDPAKESMMLVVLDEVFRKEIGKLLIVIQEYFQRVPAFTDSLEPAEVVDVVRSVMNADPETLAEFTNTEGLTPLIELLEEEPGKDIADPQKTRKILSLMNQMIAVNGERVTQIIIARYQVGQTNFAETEVENKLRTRIKQLSYGSVCRNVEAQCDYVRALIRSYMAIYSTMDVLSFEDPHQRAYVGACGTMYFVNQMVIPFVQALTTYPLFKYIGAKEWRT